VYVYWFFSFFHLVPSQRVNIDEEKLRSFGATKLHRELAYFCKTESSVPLTQFQSAQQTAHTPFHDMLPQLHTIYDIILLIVLTEV
jgi:hypothetical protein